MAMWTRLLTLVNPLGISHIDMWTNHINMWTRLLTLVQVGDWRKYALEAIIKLLFISSYHDKCLLFMLELYCPETWYMCEYIDKDIVTSMPLLD